MKYLVAVVLICTLALATPFYTLVQNKANSYSEEERERRTIIESFKGGLSEFMQGDVLIFSGEPTTYAFVGDHSLDGYVRLKILTDSIVTDAYDLFEIDKIIHQEHLAHFSDHRKVSTDANRAFESEGLYMVYRPTMISGVFPVFFVFFTLAFFFIFFFGLTLINTLPRIIRIVVSIFFVSLIVWWYRPFIDFGYSDNYIFGEYALRRIYVGLSLFVLYLFYYLLNKLTITKNTYTREAVKFFSICFFSVISLYLSMSIIGLFYPEIKLLLIFKNGRLYPEAMWVYYYLLYAFALANLLVFAVKKFRELKLEKEIAVSTQLNTTAQLNSLQARLNPHFLYNTLNSIVSLIKTDPERAEEMTLNVSKFMRHFSNRHSEHLTTVSEETEMIKEYLDIEKIRFGDKLKYEIEVFTDAMTQLLPRAILQPLVENAIKYGFNGETQSIKLVLNISLHDSILSINIYDSGHHWDDNLTKGYGLTSVYDKLELLYGPHHEISFHNEPRKHIAISIELDKLQVHD